MLVAFVSSFLIVALAEMGDKTQLVAFSLASRFRRTWMVMFEILIATTVNHALASSAGVWVATKVPESVLGWVLALSFIAFGVWTLVPDAAQDEGGESRWGPLLSTVIIFFLAEMGDKTQLATVALGARFGSPVTVTAGTTLGMLVSDGLAVFGGNYLAKRVPMWFVRRIAAGLFFAFGVMAIVRAVGVR
jgi:putative Ca2+/H+ antiporter (TMEM165/GDT1 family)